MGKFWEGFKAFRRQKHIAKCPQIKVKSIKADENGIHIIAEHEFFGIMSCLCHDFFEKFAGENLFVMDFGNKKAHYSMTLEKWGKKSIATLYQEKCNEIDELKKQLEG